VIPAETDNGCRIASVGALSARVLRRDVGLIWIVNGTAPIANLHSDAQRLVEQRVEFAPTKAKFWRLSWSGAAAPFVLTAVSGEPARQVDVELLSRARVGDGWHSVHRSGFYRLKGETEELRNGPVPVAPTTDRHWLVRTDPKRGGLGGSAPHLVVEWVAHEVVFVARGAGPFYIAYGNATALQQFFPQSPELLADFDEHRALAPGLEIDRLGVLQVVLE
jgi:Protein of unknown function (DUF3999)